MRLNVTGLCMSDIHNMINDWDAPPMSSFGVQCTGHEGAGVVVKVGSRCGPQWKVRASQASMRLMCWAVG